MSSPAAAASRTQTQALHISSPRRDAFPFSFIQPLGPNPSTSLLVPSTAQGRPIPVDDSTAEHRTSALREINNHYPSRTQYAKSSGAQSSNHSGPVIVRSYYPLAPTRPPGAARAGAVVHRGSGSGSGSDASIGPGACVIRGLPFAGKAAAVGGDGMLGTMARVRASKVPRVQLQQETRLPPVEAFTFKSFIANMEAQTSGSNINADLDRIAEICARSIYSLSNQYEVHYAPHGSGTSLLASEQQGHQLQEPTLQVRSSDGLGNPRRQKRRRHAPRGSSRAMGTLETIMSSSRSSDENHSAEMAKHVRGRAARVLSDHSSPATSSRSTLKDVLTQDNEASSKAHTRRPSASLALIDGSRQNTAVGDASASRPPATGLVSEPALPQASTSQLELRTAPEKAPEACNAGKNKTAPAPPSDGRDQPVARGSISSMQEAARPTGLFATLGTWVPWGSPGKQHGCAEGSLRHLLKATDCKGKGVAKATQTV